MDGEAVWRKSSRSGGTGDCVEVALLPETVLVRDSKDPDGPRLRVPVESWRVFVGGVVRFER